MEDRCLFCGEIIPEGLQVCLNCEVNTSRRPVKKINKIAYRYAIIINDYIYKDYASCVELLRGVDRFKQRRELPETFRLVKLKITTEEFKEIRL
jgi:predicted nucleic acid-binding Zn ribbon protein